MTQPPFDPFRPAAPATEPEPEPTPEPVVEDWFRDAVTALRNRHTTKETDQ
jgi:hypothetical protein